MSKIINFFALLIVAVLATFVCSVRAQNSTTTAVAPSTTALPPPSTSTSTTTSTTTAAPPTPTATTTPAPPQLVPPAQTVCDLPFLANLMWKNGSSASFSYIININPCAKRSIYPRYESTTGKTPAAGTASCGEGFGSYTEDTDAHKNQCIETYTSIFNTTSPYQTKYTTSSGASTLLVNWVCTGLDGDVNADKTSLVVNSDVINPSTNHHNLEVTITTKGCIRPEDNELRAGVIVAIVVVTVFVVAVISSVVKAKCFGGNSNNNANSNHFAASAAATRPHGRYNNTNNHAGTADGNYTAM